MPHSTQTSSSTENGGGDPIYPLPPLLPGIVLNRYKRFFADIQLDSGETVVAHCPNTGPMSGLYQPGRRVMVSHNDNPKRKLQYTWELVEVHNEAHDKTQDEAQDKTHDAHNNNGTPVWVGTNTALPNRVIRWALEHRLIAELGPYGDIRSEVKYGIAGRSRVDFVLQGCDRPIYVEVKNTTWADGPRALFPDTVTTRGQKHLQELRALLPDCRAVMLYFINRGDCDEFAPGDERDPRYGQLLREAVQAGLEVLPCRFEVSPLGLRYNGQARLVL